MTDIESDDPGRLMPEQILWRSAIRQAFTDLLLTPIMNGRNARGMSIDEYEHQEAIRFLTAAKGPWRRSREVACSLAGYDSDYIRDCALRLLAAKDRGENLRAQFTRSYQNKQKGERQEAA